MSLLNFAEHALWVSVAVFATAAAMVWASGTRLTGYLDGIAEHTGIGRAVMGMLFLGGVTSLPEVAAVSTAAVTGNAALATNNLLGSVSINVMMIAVADALLGRDALTSVVASSATLLHGTLNLIVLSVLSMAILTGDVPVAGAGAWSLSLCALCIGGFVLSSRTADHAPWRVTSHYHVGNEQGDRKQMPTADVDNTPLRALIVKSIAAGAVILVAGYILSRSADALAQKTGVGAGLVGLVLVGFATSLPEMSSITEAVRRRRYEMALGDVFGTNLITVALIALVDLLYTGPVLNEAGRFEAVAALLGAVLTGIFMVGLLERRNRTFLRMGHDALAAILVFGTGLVLLYFIQA